MTAGSVDEGGPGLPEHATAASEPGSCSSCGLAVDDRPATWSLSVGARGAQWLCERCTRDNLRSIEGKLDEAWW